MSKPVKDLITQEYRQEFQDVDAGCVVSVIGLDGVSANRFRNELHTKDLCVRVVKNSLARRALADRPLAPLTDSLDGPCALVTGAESAIDIAKLLVELKKSYPALELKRGMLEGDPELIEVESLAKMKNRVELLAEVAMLMSSPGRSLAGALAGPGGRIAGCLEVLADGDEGEADASDADAGDAGAGDADASPADGAA